MPIFTNIAGYKFVPLSGLKELRAELIRQCREWELKGTILLSTEGINLFVAGTRESIEKLLGSLRQIPGLEGFEVKFSQTTYQPFNRMLVRIKKEIIAFGVPGINPAQRTSPKLPARTLKQWLDEGRPVTLLDTRNDYEVKLGTFKNARAIGIEHFRDFPEAVRQLPAEMKEQPIVMFCTGGIRCEKAGPFMEQEGFRNIYQLDGGILKYFEECGEAHYDGECFVFDQRVGVDPGLRETESTQCYNCLTPLTAEEQSDERYVAGKSCPYCFRTTAEQVQAAIQKRQMLIDRAVHPLPGSVPYDNYRPITVPQDCNGCRLIEFLGRVLPHVPKDEWESLGRAGLLVDSSRLPVSFEHGVAAGERYFQKLPGLVEPDVNPAIQLLHEDEALVVLNKPAPLPMHPGGRFNRNTLQYILNQAYYPQKPRPAHRLDANTTGVVVVTRTRHFAGKVQPQFVRGEVRKEYIALVRGRPEDSEFVCELPISAEAGEAGTRAIDPLGLPARTEFRVLKQNSDGTTLLAVRPITGRTNQIRIHLWALGLPIVGDPTYLLDRKVSSTQTLETSGEPMCLHAASISLIHPLTSERATFTAPVPSWAQPG